MVTSNHLNSNLTTTTKNSLPALTLTSLGRGSDSCHTSFTAAILESVIGTGDFFLTCDLKTTSPDFSETVSGQFGIGLLGGLEWNSPLLTVGLGITPEAKNLELFFRGNNPDGIPIVGYCDAGECEIPDSAVSTCFNGNFKHTLQPNIAGDVSLYLTRVNNVYYAAIKSGSVIKSASIPNEFVSTDALAILDTLVDVGPYLAFVGGGVTQSGQPATAAYENIRFTMGENASKMMCDQVNIEGDLCDNVGIETGIGFGNKEDAKEKVISADGRKNALKNEFKIFYGEE